MCGVSAEEALRKKADARSFFSDVSIAGPEMKRTETALLSVVLAENKKCGFIRPIVAPTCNEVESKFSFIS